MNWITNYSITLAFHYNYESILIKINNAIIWCSLLLRVLLLIKHHFEAPLHYKSDYTWRLEHMPMQQKKHKK